MECVTLDIEGCHLRFADLDTRRVGACIQFAAHRQAGLGRGGSDQFHDGLAARQGLAPPCLGDVAKQLVLYFVPLRGAWRVVADPKCRPVSSASCWSSTLNSRTRE